MRLAVYARVSTTEQSTEPQLFALRAYAAARRLELAEAHVYSDHGISGAKDRRPALDKLLADARRRRFDVLACTKLDRLARSVHHLTALARELEALGIGLVVLDQAIDTTTPSGRLLFHVLGSIAEFERDLIRERTAAGMQAARRKGARIGRPEAAVDRTALARGIRAGASISELSRSLGVSWATARKALAAELSKRVDAGEAKSVGAARVDSGVEQL